MERPEISIVIPFKDEAKRLPKSLTKMLAYADAHLSSFEILLVDDGSSDGSQLALKSFLKDSRVTLLVHTENEGKGAAVRTGVLAARGKYILFSDADLATPFSELPKLIAALKKGKYDIVIGSRAVFGSVITKRQPVIRVCIGKIGNLFIRAVTGLPYRDTQCGFKLFKATSGKALFKEQHFPRWSFDIEVLYRAKLSGYRVLEAPVTWRSIPGTKVKMMDPVRVLFDTFRIRTFYGK